MRIGGFPARRERDRSGKNFPAPLCESPSGFKPLLNRRREIRDGVVDALAYGLVGFHGKIQTIVASYIFRYSRWATRVGLLDDQIEVALGMLIVLQVPANTAEVIYETQQMRNSQCGMI